MMRARSAAARVCYAFAMAVIASAAYAQNGDTQWAAIQGGPGTGCATDATPYEFYVRRADPRRVAVYFQGGGGCWNSRNCGLDGQRTFEASVDQSDQPWQGKGASGIFDVANGANPLREFTIVMAPYCTADVHLGVRTARYETGDGKRLDVNYRGLANAQRVMDWVAASYDDPQVLFVSGGSAGAIPSPIFASQLARRYPKARVVQLGDGAGAYRSARIAGLLAEWGATPALKHDPLFRDLDPASANFEDFYVRAAGTPNLRLAQLNSADDQIQVFFLGQLGHQVSSLPPLLSGNLKQVREASASFRAYTMPGPMHTILQRPEFYTTKVGDAALTQWVDDLINGRDLKDVGEDLLPAPAERLQ
jgi:Pectinacetylesterase